MVAEVTASQLWFNPSLMGFFFRTQAEETFNELINRVSFDHTETVLEKIENYFTDIDECEETFYSESVDEILEMLDLAEMEEDDDEEDDGDF